MVLYLLNHYIKEFFQYSLFFAIITEKNYSSLNVSIIGAESIESSITTKSAPPRFANIQQRKTKAPPQKSESGIPASESNHELEVHDY